MKHFIFGLGMVAICIAGARSDGATIVQLVNADPLLVTPGSVETDGVDLYLAGSGTSGQGVFRVPIGGGAVTQLYSATSPNGVTLVGSNVFWIDANSGPVTDTQVLRAPKSGVGPVTAIYTGSGVGQPIVDGSDITTDGTKLYTVDQFGGQVHSMDTSGGGLTAVSPDRFGGGFSTERNPNIALDGGTLYVGDNGHPSGTGPPGVFSVPATGGSFTTLFSSTFPDLSQLAGIAVGNGTIYLTEGNEILSMPVGGGTPTTFATDPSFGFLRGMTLFGNKLYVVGSTDTGEDGIWSIVVPEPSTFLLAALGLLSFGFVCGRRRGQAQPTIRCNGPFGRKRGIAVLLLSAITLGFVGRATDAALTVFTDRSSWETSIGSFTTETFEATTLGDLNPGVNNYSFFTATISQNDSGFTAIVQPGAVNGSRELQARLGTDFPNDPSSIDVQLFGSVLGIGADFDSTTNGDLLTLTVAGETIQFDQHLSGAGDGFLGVISDTPFSTLTLATENPTLSGEAFALDNVSFGPIPEPSAFLLATLGLLSLSCHSKRRRRR